MEPAADGWRLRHRDDDVLLERRLDDGALPRALARLDACLTARRPDATGGPSADGAPAHRGGDAHGAFSAKLAGERLLLSLVSVATSAGPTFLLTLHGRAVAPPPLDALGLDAGRLDTLRGRLGRGGGWLAVGAADTLAGERLVRAIALELVAPTRRLVCLEPPVHPPLAGVLQTGEERVLITPDALDADVVLLAATPSDTALGTLAAHAAEGLFVVQRCRARQVSDVLRRLLALGLAPAWIAHACQGVLMHHRVRLLCHHCRTRAVPDERGGHWLDTVGAPPVQDIAAWLERSLQARFGAGEGCARCHGTGHAGVHELVDLVDLDEPARAALLAGDVERALASADAGGTLGRRLEALVAGGDVSAAETARHLPRRY